MKGPGFRYDLDIRRVWECPQCGKQLRHLGHITSRRCTCDEEGHWMQIVEERFRRTFPEREKIVIPEEEPEETPAQETTVSDSPKPEDVEAGAATETAAPPPGTDAGPPVEESPPPPGTDDRQAPASDSDSNEPHRRKKRRKKRRRKKNRKNQPPEASGNPESPNSGQTPNKNPQSGSDNDDFGKNVF